MDAVKTAKELLKCANSWEPEARLVGNIRASELRSLAEKYESLQSQNRELVEALEKSNKLMKETAGAIWDRLTVTGKDGHEVNKRIQKNEDILSNQTKGE